MKNSTIMRVAAVVFLAIAMAKNGDVEALISAIFLATSVICDTIETKGK